MLTRPRHARMPDLTQVAHAIQEMRQPVVFVPLASSRADESKHLARIQELEESERQNSARLAELEKTFSSLLSLVHAKDRIEEVTTPKHDIVVTEDAVFVADGLNLSKYARVKLPMFQAIKRWAMGQ